MIDVFSLFQYSFMQRALVAGVCIAVLAPLVGMFVVAKRYAMISDTLAHVALASLAISSVLGTAPLITVGVCTVITALGIEYLRRTGRFSGEQVLSLFLSGSLAIAVIIMSVSHTTGIQSVLFGSLSTVSVADMWTIIIASIAIGITLFLLFPQLLSVVFHEELASVAGVRTQLIQYIIVACAALTITLALRIVGGLLVGALMVVPVLAASQFRLSFARTIIAAMITALIAVLSGLYFAILWDLPSGASIVVSLLIIFLLTSLYRYARTA